MNINEITAPPGHAEALKRLATDDEARSSGLSGFICKGSLVAR
jgi:hypothetical protein